MNNLNKTMQFLTIILLSLGSLKAQSIDLAENTNQKSNFKSIAKARKAGEEFGQLALDRYEGRQVYKEDTESIINNYKNLSSSQIYKDGKAFAKQVVAKKSEYKVKDIEGELADKKSINLDVAMSRYLKNFHPSNKKEEALANLMIFVSFSIPEQSLMQIADQAKKVGGQLVLRGMINGSMKETMQALLKLNANGVRAIIHPKLFERFNVTHVPTFVLLDASKSYCGEESCTPLHDRMVGNVSLDYALQTFAEQGDIKDLSKEYLTKWKGKE